jgi:predicted CoA-binding protein
MNLGGLQHMTYQHPTAQKVKEILEKPKRIAVIGISDRTDRASYQVSAYMQQQGYEILPINPRLDTVLGIKAYKSLEDIEGPIDIVNVFRRSEETPPVAEAAVKAGAKVLWLQLGIRNEEAYKIAIHGGLNVIMDRCIKVDHAQLRI